jgi:PAS domain S-box-containing protein
MPPVSEFAEFAEALRRRRVNLERAAPRVLRDVGRGLGDRDAAPLRRTTRLLADAVHDLGAAEEELRLQNEALFRARLDLEEREATFRRFFELAPVACLVTSPDTRIQAVNEAAGVLLGRPANALVGRTLAALVDADERPAFRTALARCAVSPRAEEFPMRLERPLGPPVDCRLRVRAMPAAAADLADSLAWCVTEESQTLPGQW